MKGAEILMRALEAEGVNVVFGYPGGAIMPVYDALVDSPIRHVLTRHEQGASLAANGFARACGEVGVCIGTSGPGATNLITGIADAYLDSVPMVAITGQVPTCALGTDAFQEVDTIGLTMPVVKHSRLIENADEIEEAVAEAFAVARSGRPGPVVLDLPKDVAQAEVDQPRSCSNATIEPAQAPREPDAEAIAAALRELENAQRPVIMAGAGISKAGAVDAFRAFVDHYKAPVVTTLLGVGSIPTDDPSTLGMLGMHGSKAANLAVQASDLLICLGARLDDRATGRLDKFAPNAALVHVDIDPAELGKRRAPSVAIPSDLTQALPLLRPVKEAPQSWRDRCRQTAADNAFNYNAPFDSVFAPTVIKKITERTRGATFACDVGQHQMWVAQHACIDDPKQHLTSGGLGTMGFGVPAAMGAQLARPDDDKPTLVFTGDGSIMMNIQEFATIRRYRLPVKIVLFDNSGLGLVRQWQQLFFSERFSEVDLSDNPDFVTVAESFGIPGIRIDRAADVDDGIERLLAVEGPAIAHVIIDARENVWPLVPPNASNDQMMDESADAGGLVCDTA